LNDAILIDLIKQHLMTTLLEAVQFGDYDKSIRQSLVFYDELILN